MPLWSFWTVTAVLFLGAISLLYWGLWGDRSKGRLRCPKCWYDMSGSFVAGKLVCPECGKDAGVEKRLKKNHCRWWAAVVAVVLVLPHLYSGYVWYEWRREQDAGKAIVELNGKVIWQSHVSYPILKWIPKHLRFLFDRVDTVDCRTIRAPDAALAHVEGQSRLCRRC